MVAGMGLTFEDLKKKKYISVEPVYRKYEKSGFDTPSGKVELYSSIFEKNGYDPLPDYKEPPESPVTTPELMKDYPLILTTGGRSITYFCSEGRQIRALRKLGPDPEVEIHPDTARNMDISGRGLGMDRDPAGQRGTRKAQGKATSGIDPRVVHAAYGWWYPEMAGPEHGCFDSNINTVLTGDPRGTRYAGRCRRRQRCAGYTKRHKRVTAKQNHDRLKARVTAYSILNKRAIQNKVGRSYEKSEMDGYVIEPIKYTKYEQEKFKTRADFVADVHPSSTYPRHQQRLGF